MMSDNWPKHPDGTNMTLGEMPEADRKRIMRDAAERYKARCDGSEVHRVLSEALDRINKRSDT